MLLAGCRREEAGTARAPTPAGEPASGVRATPGPTPAVTPAVRYGPQMVEGAKALARLQAELGDEGMTVVLKINRVDLKHVRQGEMLIIPEATQDQLAVSPFPREIQAASAIPKLLLVSRRVQAFGAYASGQLVHWGPTSTGKRATPTPAGLYHTNWKAKQTTSTINEEWVLPWYFNLDNFEGISLHRYDLPGYPASHACVRLLEEDASWIYSWAEQWILSKDGRTRLAYGTPVIVFGDYLYGPRPPWKRLAEDAQAASVTTEEVEKAVQKYLPVIVERVRQRETFLSAAAQAKPDSESLPR
jgi:lipoprotein-anchoring transpeptidase ErfK/SrfK